MCDRATSGSMGVMTSAARTEEVVPGLYRIDLGHVNAYLLDTGRGPVLVDTGFPGDELPILGALAELALAPARLTAILLTHAHAGHAGGAAALREATGAPIHMHPRAASLVAFEPDGELIPGGPAPELPGVTVLGAPGHSAGQVVLRWNRHGGVLVAADAATNHAGGPAPHDVCEDPVAAARTFGRLPRLAVDKAVFGHGEPILSGAGAALRAQARDERQASRSLTALPVRSTPPS
jgi:glyoxylase-like metal-dependent hydrolase (beta-lactamase superfamily II)